MQFTLKKKPDMEITLCPGCASFYYDNKNYWIERINTTQKALDECMICRNRNGYDFRIWKLKKPYCPVRTIAKEAHNE